MASISVFVGLIAVGYAARRAGWLTDAFTTAIPELLTRLCYPAMILCSIGSLHFADISAMYRVAAATAILTVLLFLLSRLFFARVAAPMRPVLQFECCVGNVSYVLIPLLTVWGATSLLPGILIHGAVQDVFIWTIFYSLFAKTEGKGWRILLNPCLLAFGAGVLLAVFRIPIPQALDAPLKTLRDLTTPLALLFLGATTARFGIFRWMRSRSAIFFAIGKVLVLPVLVYLVCGLVLSRAESLLLALAFGAPTPLIAVVWASRYELDAAFAADCCVISTILYLGAFCVAQIFIL